MRELSGNDREELRKAIISAYPNLDGLQIVLKESDLLKESVSNLPSEKSFNVVVDKLIEWAEANGKLKDLIKELHNKNPGNPELNNIKNRLLESVSSFKQILHHPCTISLEHWKSLCPIITGIDLDLISRICQETLRSINKNIDFLGNYPELVNLKNYEIVKRIFLENYPENNQKKPTIIEFAERLAKKSNNTVRDELNDWVKNIAQELKIELPTYFEAQLYDNSKKSSIYLPYLLITSQPQGNKFLLNTELFINDQNLDINQRIDEFKLHQPPVECDFTDIPDIIYKFIKDSERYLRKYVPYDLTIELFLPLKDLGMIIDLKEIPIGLDNKRKPIGNEYRFVVRSFERACHNKYLSELTNRWNKLKKLQSFVGGNNKKYFEHLLDCDGCNWEELVYRLESQEKLALKITCGLPEPEQQKELFTSIIRGGVPISLWIRSNNLSDKEKKKVNQILNLKSLTNLSDLFKSIHESRKEAHRKQDKENYLGYHLGILCDNPNRIPFHLRAENEQLIPTGM